MNEQQLWADHPKFPGRSFNTSVPAGKYPSAMSVMKRALANELFELMSDSSKAMELYSRYRSGDLGLGEMICLYYTLAESR